MWGPPSRTQGRGLGHNCSSSVTYVGSEQRVSFTGKNSTPAWLHPFLRQSSELPHVSLRVALQGGFSHLGPPPLRSLPRSVMSSPSPPPPVRGLIPRDSSSWEPLRALAATWLPSHLPGAPPCPPLSLLGRGLGPWASSLPQQHLSQVALSILVP